MNFSDLRDVVWRKKVDGEMSPKSKARVAHEVFFRLCSGLGKLIISCHDAGNNQAQKADDGRQHQLAFF